RRSETSNCSRQGVTAACGGVGSPAAGIAAKARGLWLGEGEVKQKEEIERSLSAPMSPSPTNQSPPATKCRRCRCLPLFPLVNSSAHHNDSPPFCGGVGSSTVTDPRFRSTLTVAFQVLELNTDEIDGIAEQISQRHAISSSSVSR
ncbi:hypothetical protein U1Q18_037377, partial [Sarracenia purpurea var. burkii]